MEFRNYYFCKQNERKFQMNEKKRYTAEQKITILRDLLENNTPISQVAEKYGVHVNDIVNFITIITKKTEMKIKILLKLIDINSNKYYLWKQKIGMPNNHNGIIPKDNWLLDWEKEAIILYAKNHIGEGYRRLTYMMMDENVVAASPSTVYRILKSAGLLNKWNRMTSRYLC